MKITVFKNYGYCWGVKRAVDIARQELKKGEPVYILGPVIHNPNTNNELKGMGLIIMDSVEKIPDDSFFFYPSHGISKQDQDLAEKKKLKATSLVCPFVIKIADLAEEYEQKGYDIIIYGDPDHTEVKSLVSRLENAQVVNQCLDVKKLQLGPRILYISQSTSHRAGFYDVFSTLSACCMWSELTGRFTICQATFERQDWVTEHIDDFEYFIIVGGLQSSNTSKLKKIVDQNGKRGIHIEHWRPEIWDEIRTLNSIAVISGTSTPKEDVDEIVNEIKGRLAENGNNIGIYYA